MSQQCRICGTITGQHGFSFGEHARVAQEQARKEAAGAAGVLMIPAELVPESQDEALFMEQFHAALAKVMEKRIDIPEIRIIPDE